MRWTIAVLVFLFCVDAVFAKNVTVEGVKVVIVSPPGAPSDALKVLKHCKVYTSDVRAEFNNPAVRKEIKDTDANWTLSHKAEYCNSSTDNYPLFKNVYSILYQRKTTVKDKLTTVTDKLIDIDKLVAVWRIYKYQRIQGRNVGSGANSFLAPANFARASYFEKPGQWKMTFTAALSVKKDEKNSAIVYKSSGENSFEVDIEGTKILVHTFEGAGAYTLVSKKSIQDEFKSILKDDKDNKWRVVWTPHSWAGAGNAVRQIIKRYNDCEGCGHYDTVVLVGHSLGGHAVMKCIEKLHHSKITMWGEEKNYCIDVSLAFTIDPAHQKYAFPVPRPTNAGDWGFVLDKDITKSHLNFFQRCDTGSIAGVIPIWGDKVENAVNTEFAATVFMRTIDAHVQIVNLVKEDFADALKEVPSQKSAPGTPIP